MIAPLAPAPQPILREYQREAVEAVLAQPTRGRRSAHFCLPTGSGKSVVLAEIVAQRLCAGRILALVPRIELADQLVAHMRRRLDVGVGVVQGERVELGPPVTVAVVDSMRADRIAALGVVGTLIVDECHHAAPGTRYERVLEQLRRENPNLVLVGCTATPLRHDERRIGDVVGPCIFSRSIAALQDDGYLAPFTYARVTVPELDLRGLTENGRSANGRSANGDYDEDELAAAVEAAVQATVSATTPFLRDRKTLAFGVNVAHAQQLAAAFGNAGFRAEAVWGAMPSAQRRDRIERFAAGDLDLLANCGVLTEGYDCPSVTALLMARPTRAIGLYVQMLGRGTRPHPGKMDCRVVDVAGIADPTAVPQLLLESATMRAYRHIEQRTVDRESVARLLPNPKRLAGGFGEVHAWVELSSRSGRLALACSAAQNEIFVAAPVDRTSGLYVALAARDHGRTVEVLGDPEPIEAVGERLRARLEACGTAALNRRETPWRNAVASGKQRAVLHRTYAGRPPAVNTRGEASDAIVAAHARMAIQRYLRGAA